MTRTREPAVSSEGGYRQIEVGGRPREIGRQIGEAARDLIAASMDYYMEHHEAMTGISFAEAEEAGGPYLECAREWLPSVVEELEGLAEGSGVPVGKLLVPNCGEEFTAEKPASHCTTFAISRERRLLAHNEDWFAGDVENIVLLRMTLADGTTALAITAPCLLAGGGLNSHGVATSGNTLFCNDGRIGVPNTFIARWTLEAQTLEDARSRSLLGRRAGASNHLFVDRNGRICDVETSATSAVVCDARPYYVHTNHCLYEETRAHEDDCGLEGSRLRYDRAVKLLERGLRGDDDEEALAELILADHANRPASICDHPDETVPLGARECTTSSVVWDLDDMSGSFCVGPPCVGTHHRVSLF